MDIFSKEKRSVIMSKVRSKANATTELRLVELFRENHICGWRRNLKLTGKPDFVFPASKVVVFVDGCFWHGCSCTKGKLPKTNRAFWEDKIKKNRLRDGKVSRILRKKGYSVIRIRECCLKKNPSRQLARVLKVLNRS